MRSDDGSGPIEGLHLQTLGLFPRGLAEDLVASLSRRVRLPCRLAPAPLDTEVPYLSHRQQADADQLLVRLEARPRDPDAIEVVLTQHDLGNPIFTHFFGVARLHGRVALVSLARLRPEFYGRPGDPALVTERALREILHELGHTGGLAHCDDSQCLMHFAATVDAIDNRGPAYCASCAGRLPWPVHRPPA